MQMAWRWTLCILATHLPVLTTNLFTSCDARHVRIFNSASWDPAGDLDYLNPADIEAYSSFDSSSLAPFTSAPSGEPVGPPFMAPQPSATSISGPTKPPTASISMVSGPPEHAAKPPTHHHHHHPRFPVWCVARPTVPEPVLQKAMDYACGSGADCKNIMPNGSCFMPNSLFAHASYAFNSYWQRTKANGGTCDFGATAMLITVDPSFDGCQFIYT